jgi:hypothetical protein
MLKLSISLFLSKITKGDQSFPLQQERISKRNILLKTTEILKTEIAEPTLFKVKKY